MARKRKTETADQQVPASSSQVDGSQGSSPKEPETEKGQQMRTHYLTCAQSVLNDGSLEYGSLYQRYVIDPQAAQGLDQRVARVALKSGSGTRQVIQVLAQGPFTQAQTQGISADEKKAKIPGLLKYAQETVDAVQQQRYVEYANVALGKVQAYPDLYREHVGTDLTAIQLDQRVVAAALQGGESADAIASLLQQGPYARFQRDVKQMDAAGIEHYARGAIAQVQDIQALRLGQTQRSTGQEQILEP
ncbi:MAG: hypothetical protein AAGD25_33075 [Cyanobacteria bacterium P01_F01_bin.150]